ncbi:MAG TPA: hypothetical protein VHC20_06555 [Candidatus Paceibacterota bacterium]|nr:hypothetical protein [Candidatus Paceibacterota bacterium]
MTPDENLKSTWSSIFSRKGGSGEATRLWADWDDGARATALGKSALEGEELPVVMARSKDGGPVLLTTRRLICDSGTAQVREVVSIKPVEFTEKKKDQLNELDVELSSGRSLRIAVEPGASYFALWSVLLNIAKRNAHRPLAS